MAFKSKSVKRFSVRNFLATILHAFMSSPTDLPGVFTQGDTRTPVGDWHSVLMTSELSSQCDLERMVFCKCTKDVQHEFILLHFRHPVQRHAVAVLVLDRTSRVECTENNGGSFRSVGQASVLSPSVSQVPAHDTISTTFNSPSALESYLTQRYRSYRFLSNLDFPASARPSAMQVSVLLCVLSKHSPTYRLWQYQCYWYAHTVWETLKTLFDGCQETTLIDGRSQFWGQDVPKAESVEEVCKQYRVEWALFENVVEERRKRKEEEERWLRMEGGAQRQPEIDKERRKREEAERRVEEERKQREEAEREHEAEMNRMREIVAELERRAV
ncbi:hypothetical protein DFJ58DRAFT_821114 [Suillus subalutaceus]|uniref:uncharacterized protein n=1 Tax=Suillus subalutaceus TaxID=48586 RepID=UPI001B85BC12|nr:uncharacterized protein DFJ58DRAFT_821114 [Suillus subalutaceus]KAG1834964.1 hypothetical protein DFJ58DRAFT_821114 [Suillus subalutaceus]